MSNTVTAMLDIPAPIQHALLNGTAERIGGVVRHVETKQILALLRESSAVPVSPASLGEGLSRGLSQALGFSTQTASYLNLGATVAFGAATLYKLNKIDKKLDALAEKLSVVEGKIDELGAKMDRLSWSVEIGFASTLRSLSILERSIENDINAQLTAAAQGAWSAQFLAPDSAQRMIRLEQARAMANVATERMVAQTLQEYNFVEMLLDNSSEGSKPYLQLKADSAFAFLTNVRKSAVAISLNGNVMAECGDTYAAAAITKDQARRLKDALLTIGRQYLGGGALHIYAELMKSVYANVMPIDRLETWIRRFEPKWDGFVSIVDALRTENRLSSNVDTFDEDFWESEYGVQAIKFCTKFFDLMELCWEDVSRLEGFAIELAVASRYMDSWQQYRDMFVLENVSEEQPLVFMIPNAELIAV